MNKLTKLWLPLAFALILSGCVRMSVTKLDSSWRNPVPSYDVKVYIEANDVPPSCMKIALLHGKASHTWTNENDMVKKAREKAGRLGANALLLVGFSEPSAGAKVAGAFLGTPVDRGGKMVALDCPE